MDNLTVKRLAIQCGIDPDFFQGGELEKFAKAVEKELFDLLSIEIEDMAENGEYDFIGRLRQFVTNTTVKGE